MKVAGIDPGYGITGWALLMAGPPVSALGYGVFETPGGMILPARLAMLLSDAQDFFEEHKPEAVVVERLFFNRNRTTAPAVYEARGVLIAAAGAQAIPVYELSPNAVKKSVAGHGNAGKQDMTRAVQALLRIPGKISPDDAADALAIALAGILHVRSQSILAAVGGRGVRR